MKVALSLFLMVLCCSFSFAQEGWEDANDLLSESELTEGIYINFKEYQENAPSISGEMKLNDESLFIKDSAKQWVAVDADKVWGCAFNSKLYIAYEGRFWKSLNSGSLLLFGVIEYKTVARGGVVNPGFTVSQEPVGNQLFLDTNTGSLRSLNYRNLKPYLDKEPSIIDYMSKNKINKTRHIAHLLKLYNELNP